LTVLDEALAWWVFIASAHPWVYVERTSHRSNSSVNLHGGLMNHHLIGV
jgi:hypothetical protein